jgi:hypothetical protein
MNIMRKNAINLLPLMLLSAPISSQLAHQFELVIEVHVYVPRLFNMLALLFHYENMDATTFLVA